MKKGPNLRWSLIQCSGGDEGDRTPDLLTASQALSQLSYAPVRRSTIRELGRRCKDNFGKTFAGAAAHRAVPARGALGLPIRGLARATGPIIGTGRIPSGQLAPKPCPITGLGRHTPTMPESAKAKPQVVGSLFSKKAAYGRPLRIWPRNPAWF